MARGVNKVILIGNVGQDPEVRFTQAGTPVANISLATTETWMDKNSGQKQEKTEWHRLILFRKLAEIAQQYVRKGSKLYIEGRIQTRKWQDQQGQDRYVTEVIVNDLQMLDSRQSGNSPQGGYGQNMPPQGYGQQQGAPAGQPGNPGGNYPQGGAMAGQQAQANYAQQQGQGPGAPAGSDFDDEIPFAPLHGMAGG